MNNLKMSEETQQPIQPKNFSHIKIGQYIRCIKEGASTFNKWFQRVECPFGKEQWGINEVWLFQQSIGSTFGWEIDWFDLSDIRDIPPDLIIANYHGSNEYQSITNDNIIEVLEYNGFQYIGESNYLTKYMKNNHYFFVPVKGKEHVGYFYMKSNFPISSRQIEHPNLYKVLDFMNEFYPLEPLPKFDFV